MSSTVRRVSWRPLFFFGALAFSPLLGRAVSDAKKDLNDPWREVRSRELKAKGFLPPPSTYELFAEDLKEKEADKKEKSNPKDVWKGLSSEVRCPVAFFFSFFLVCFFFSSFRAL